MIKTMEAVWKDIHLSSLHPHSHHTNFRGANLQDFLAQPFSKDPLPPTTAYAPPPPPDTVLTLNSDGPNSFPQPPRHNISGDCSFRTPPFGVALASSPPTSSPANGKKRFPESENRNSGDQRHKRMIKNRESAARSRARKQAYTNELEIEVAHLMEENSRLKKQQQLWVAAIAELPQKRSLHRSSSAPF